MFDLGFAELLIIGVVALIVVGPKDLPGMFRTVGQFTGKARKMARDFQRAMNDAAEESGVGDVTKGLKAAANPAKFGLDAVKDAAKEATSWQPPEPAEDSTLSEDRAEAAAKIQAATAAKATERLQAEAAAAEEGAQATDEAPAQATQDPAKSDPA
ncbi:preprotein translocase subunit TatB [Actibacterium mucosum KCTC 23349]|uniref:Sec-independent protein translocase protein TatB n=1 Tax=Actibacterium mucosum KCTC 23349 TaxID=1454373 RepID=A0A037ZJ07_9RHOB|nr:Sec-independent protein translocase protein TatB [Actibacterium mucosum]KAJ55532.1 preprotein translocase subunit TatB [Actibacterium mucosum KCTC 23349]